MKSIKKILIVLYFVVITIDAFSAYFNYISLFKYLGYFTPCLLIILYFLSAKKEDYMYMFSFLFLFLGIHNYNYTTLALNEKGLFCYAAGILIYIIIAKRNLNIKDVNKGLKKFIPVFLFIFGIIYLVLDRVTGSTMIAVATYSITIFCFFTIGLGKYFNKKTKHNKLLFLSASLILLSGILGAYVFYWELIIPVRIASIYTFAFGHLAMCLYMIQFQKKDLKTPFLNEMLQE